jgi:hypothetical protein
MSAGGPSSCVAGSRNEGSSEGAEGLGDEGGTNGVQISPNTAGTGGQPEDMVLERGIDSRLPESSRTDPM